jgi:hypothetical protein
MRGRSLLPCSVADFLNVQLHSGALFIVVLCQATNQSTFFFWNNKMITPFATLLEVTNNDS